MPQKRGSSEKGGGSAGRCPICGKPPDAKLRPFCSKRCADIDLNRWLTGGYVIRSDDDDDSERPDGEDPSGA